MGIFSPDTITDFVRRGDLEGVRRRVELGDNVNERRMFQYTPLIEAAMYNFCSIIEVLLDHNAAMELVDFNKLTALHMAIDKKNIDAALVLARRGASANEFGFLERTPLQSAVKRNLLEVTAELLRHGADPTIVNKNNMSAKDYVQWAPNREKFLELLDAFTDLESAIRVKNEDAITVWLRRALTGDPMTAISGIDAAILLQHTDAVFTILQISLTTRMFDDQVQKYKSVQAGIENASGVDWRQSLTLVGDAFKKNWLEKVLQSQDVEKLQWFTENIGADWMKQVMFNSGWTPLHYAASVDNFAFIQYLLLDCGLSPLALNFDKKTARDVAVEAGSSSELCWMLQQHMKKRAFSEQSTLLLSSKVVTMDSLQQLLRQMTSVYDLRIIFNLGFQTLAPDEMHTVLIEAFGEIIREKLVFDDKAAVFFNMGLQECKRHSFLSEVELVEWDLKATKVNVENSDWVREIKQALQDVECRVATTERNVGMLHTQFDALRNALIEREQSQIKHRERQRYISLLSSALIMCGGGVIEDVFGAAFDLWDPEQLLSTLSAEHMTDFLAEKTNTLLFKGGVEALLVDAHVDPVEFAVVLRNAINLERIETMTPEETTASPGSDEEYENPLFSPKKINTFRAAVLAAIQAAKVKTDEEKPAPQSSSSSPPTFDSQMSEEDMAAYPYHYAVRFSEGDFDRFQEIVEYIEVEGDEINETVNIHVRSADSGNQWKVVEASALVYASYLGHVDIVKWFLARDDVVKTEQKFLTIKRSRSSLTYGNEVCIKCLASGA